MKPQEIIGVCILIIAIVALAWCFIILYRNNKVFAFRIAVSNMVYDNNKAHMAELTDDEIESAWDVLHSVSYERMLFRFWVPLKIKYWWTVEELNEMLPHYNVKPNNQQDHESRSRC